MGLPSVLRSSLLKVAFSFFHVQTKLNEFGGNMDRTVPSFRMLLEGQLKTYQFFAGL